MITVLVFVTVLLAFIFLGTPIAFALLLCSIAMVIQLDLTDSLFVILSQETINGANSFPLLAIPFFVLAGELMNEGGLAKRIVDLPMKLVGHLHGGLGFVTIFAALIMASLSGSAVADTAMVAAMLMPLIRSANYPTERSAGLMAAGGIIAPVLPPSIPLIIFGVTSGVSITQLFMAGIVPGLLMAGALIIVWKIQIRKLILPRGKKASSKEILHSFRKSIWALLLPVIIIGGFRSGLFTPTEAGVVAAFYALFVSLVIYRELPIKRIYHVLVATGKTTSVVMFLVASAQVSAWLMAYAELPQMVSEYLEPLIDSPILLLLVLMLAIFTVGTFMDLTPTVLILTPVFMPLILEAGIHPVHFGILFIMNSSICLITPPVGNVLNVVCGVAKISFVEAVRGVIPYVLALLCVLLLLLFFPAITLVPLQLFMPGVVI